jgi:hypothetical protein
MSARYPRRLILQGFGGLAIALPFLEFTGRAYGQTTAPPRRFITFFDHGGTLSNCSAGVYGYAGFSDGTKEMQEMDGWRPTSSPNQPLVLGAIHKPLTDAGLTSDVLVLRGIDNNAAQVQGDYGNGHGISNVTILTAGKGKNADEADDKSIAYSASIDQVIGGRWGPPAGGLAVVNLNIDAHNYGSPYFRGPKQYASAFSNPQDAFNTLLAGVQNGPGGPNPAVVRAQLMRRSILDGTAKGLEKYKNDLTSQDKQTVEAHLEHIRSIELRLATAIPPPAPSCSKPNLGTFNPNSIPSISPLMVDIGLAALRCGRTRVLNIEIGDFHMTWDPTVLPFDVGYDIGHSLHHMARDLGKTGPLTVQNPTWKGPWQQAMIRNRQFRAQLVAKLLKGLKDTPETGGDMLTNSLFLWTSEFSNGAVHSGMDMPFLLAGKGGHPTLKTGRYVNYNTKAATNDFTNQYTSTTTTNNLYTSVLNVLGFNDTGFGDMAYAKTPGALTGLI